MNPEDVPAELVEAGARAIHAWNCCPMDEDSQCYGEHLYTEEVQARHALAAVLRHPEAEHAEGYLHRDRQVRTVLALEAARLAAMTEEPT